MMSTWRPFSCWRLIAMTMLALTMIGVSSGNVSAAPNCNLARDLIGANLVRCVLNGADLSGV